MYANRHKFSFGLWLSLIILVVVLPGFSEARGLVKTRSEPRQINPIDVAQPINLKLNSNLLGREIPYRLILPRGYDNKENSAVKYPVIYLLHGLTGSYTNWTDRTKLAQYAVAHNFIIVTPDGANGWYSDSISTPNDKYESYIVKELVPEVEKKYRALADRDHRFIAGLSMGGYGSLKFGLKYPDMFSMVGSFSGALGATDWTEKMVPGIGKSLDAVFGPADGDARKSNDIFRIVRDATPEKLKGMPYIFQSCGTEDFLIDYNHNFLKLLNEKKVPHEYREHPGIHDWVFWDDQIREFLDLAETRLKK